MLREARNATWARRLSLIGWRYELTIGGATTVQNLQLLCAPCNQRKGGTL